MSATATIIVKGTENTSSPIHVTFMGTKEFVNQTTGVVSARRHFKIQDDKSGLLQGFSAAWDCAIWSKRFKGDSEFGEPTVEQKIETVRAERKETRNVSDAKLTIIHAETGKCYDCYLKGNILVEAPESGFTTEPVLTLEQYLNDTTPSTVAL